MRKVWKSVCILLAVVVIDFLYISCSVADTVYTNKPEFAAKFSFDAPFEDKVKVLKKAFPENEKWYWNKWTEAELNGEDQRRITINNYSTIVSTKKCPNYEVTATKKNTTDKIKVNVHGYEACKATTEGLKIWKCRSNNVSSKWGGNYQCWGFANYIFKVLWGNDGYAYKYSYDKNCLDWVGPGDEVRANGHSYIIIDVNKNQDTDSIVSYKVLDCNSDNHCKIAWRTVSRSTVEKRWKTNTSYNFVVLHNKHTAEPTDNTKVFKRSTDPQSMHEYILYSGHMSWTEAKNYAERLGEGYTLATMNGDSTQEQSIIQDLVDQFGKACWLGGNNLNGDWQWIGGEAISLSDSRWDKGEPSGGNEHYLGIYGDSKQTSYATIYKWNDFSNNSNTIKGFVVEYTPKRTSFDKEIISYQRAVYKAMTASVVKEEPYTESNTVENVAHGDWFYVTAAYRNDDGDIWYFGSLDNGKAGYIKGVEIALDSRMPIILAYNTCTFLDDYPGILKQGQSYIFHADFQTSDSVLSISATITNKSTEKIEQEYKYSTGSFIQTAFDLNTLGLNQVLDTSRLNPGDYLFRVDLTYGYNDGNPDYGPDTIINGEFSVQAPISDPTPTPTPGSANKPEPKDKVEAFVTRCYNLMLDRNPDTVGFAYWVDTLKNGTKTAAEIIKGFTDSKEFQGKKLRNEAAVEILYKTMLSRGSDAGGKAYWVKKLEAGQSLAAIINGFCDSTEFKKLCAEYGIKPGSVTIDPAPVTPDNPVEPGNVTPEQRTKVEAFVTRCYSLMLNRNPDAGGLAYWTDHLCNGTKPAAEIINGFCVSTEFVNKNLSKEDSVEILYKTMLGRGSDAGGKAYWMNKLNEGQPYAAIINGFCVSNEFKRICSEYGITPGSVKGMEGARAKTPTEEQGDRTTATPEPYDPTIITAAVRTMNAEKAEEYVRRCYRIILGRDADQGGLEAWVKKLTSGQKTPDQVARNFFSSEEFRRRTLNSEELVKMLYKVYLNREADASGLAAWKTKLDEGTALEDVIKSFVKSKEYKAVLEKMWK